MQLNHHHKTNRSSGHLLVVKTNRWVSIFHVQPKFWHVERKCCTCLACGLTHWMPLCAVPPVVLFRSTICVISVLSLALAITGKMRKPSAAFISDSALFSSIQRPKSRSKHLRVPGYLHLHGGFWKGTIYSCGGPMASLLCFTGSSKRLLCCWQVCIDWLMLGCDCSQMSKKIIITSVS